MEKTRQIEAVNREDAAILSVRPLHLPPCSTGGIAKLEVLPSLHAGGLFVKEVREVIKPIAMMAQSRRLGVTPTSQIGAVRQLWTKTGW